MAISSIGFCGKATTSQKIVGTLKPIILNDPEDEEALPSARHVAAGPILSRSLWMAQKNIADTNDR
jgi:hypothetical protein